MTARAPATGGQRHAWDDLTAQLAETRAVNLAAETLDAAGRLIADTIICALAAAPFERSRMLRESLAQDGGAPQSRVLGTDLRLPAGQAAMANAEAANLLDADDTLLNAAHFGALVATVALAEGDRVDAAWDEVRRAVVLGFELDARLLLAGRTQPGFFAPGLMLPGAAVAAAVLGGADTATMRRVLGVGMRLAPGPVSRRVSLGELTTLKYAPYATLAHEAILAARLGAAGYASDHRLMVSSPGFLDGQRVAQPRLDRLAPADRGWWIEQTSLKPFPSFRVGQPAITTLCRSLERDGIDPASVDRVRVYLDPRARSLPFHRWPQPLEVSDALLPIAASMNLPLSMALAAMGVPPGPAWLDRERLADPALRALAARIELMDETAVTSEQLDWARDPSTGLVRNTFVRIVVTAGGREVAAEASTCDGDPWWPETRPDWSWLAKKARNFLGDDALVEGLRALGGGASIGDALLDSRGDE